jgi:dihydropyrimidinase
MVSSDHYPLPAEAGADSFGTAGLQPRLALVHSLGVCTGRLSLRRWVEVCCTNPARILGLSRKGKLAPGYDADLVLFDPGQRVVLSPETLDVPHPATLFDGIEVTGWPVATVSRGDVIARDGAVLARPGRGRFVPTGV